MLCKFAYDFQIPLEETNILIPNSTGLTQGISEKNAFLTAHAFFLLRMRKSIIYAKIIYTNLCKFMQIYANFMLIYANLCKFVQILC